MSSTEKARHTLRISQSADSAGLYNVELSFASDGKEAAD
jgi:hypothetical protein